MNEELINEKIKPLLENWRKHNISEIDSFKMKEYEKIFARIYSFEYVVIQIDAFISEQENKNKPEPLKVTLNGQQIVLISEKKSKEEFLNKWKQLSDIGLNSTERKELNIQYEDYLKLKYARYMGFIEGVCQRFNIQDHKK